MAVGSRPCLSAVTISTTSLNWQAMEGRKESADMEERKEVESAAMDDDHHRSITLLDDIVADILQRLPMKPLFRCNCVSKQWNSVISNPIFMRIYLQRARCSAKSLSSSPPHLWKMVYPHFKRSYHPGRVSKKARASPPPIHDNEPSFHVSVLSQNRRSCTLNHNIVASSNGLTLSFASNSKGNMMMQELEFCVSNPLTRQSVLLPCLTGPFSRWAFGLSTRFSAASFTYKVVVFIQRLVVVSADSGSCTLMTFSSDTGLWRTDKELMSCPPAILNKTFTRDDDHNGSTRENAYTYKGILHWFDWSSRTIVTYDPYDNPHRFGCICLPNGTGKGKMKVKSGMNLIHLGGHQDLIKFCEIECCAADYRLCVWRLVDYDKGDWLLENRWPISVSGFRYIGWLINVNQLVAPDPWNGDLLCCLFARKNHAHAVYVRSSKSQVVDLSKVIVPDERPVYALRPVVPVALNPWSSPFYAQPRNKSSLVVTCRNKFLRESILSFPLFEFPGDK